MALAEEPQGTVEFDKASPAGGNGQVSASGTYKAKDGWKPVSIKLLLVPKGGGRARTTKSTDIADGKWGPLRLGKPPSGEYTAVVWLILRHEKKGEVTIGSRIASVEVP